MRGLIGFNWIPGWNATGPNTRGIYYAQYTSSGYTLLGTLLWVLDPNGPRRKKDAVNWSNIDINKSFLSSAVANKINFAGTSGNQGHKFFVAKGSQPQRNVLPGCNVANKNRKDCIGPAGAEKQACLHNNSCCYQPNIVIIDDKEIPWCYKKMK